MPAAKTVLAEAIARRALTGPHPLLVSLHPPGVLAQVAVIGAWHSFFQYQFRNIVLFERDKKFWIYPPSAPSADEPPSTASATVDRLIAYPISLDLVPKEQSDSRTTDWLEQVIESGVGEDFAPLLLPDLQRWRREGNSARFQDLFRLLDVLTSYNAFRRDQFILPTVHLGASTVDTVLERLAARRAPPYRESAAPEERCLVLPPDEVRQVVVAAGGGALRGGMDAWELLALAERSVQLDSSTGRETYVVALHLRCASDRWQLTRRFLFWHLDPGIEMS